MDTLVGQTLGAYQIVEQLGVGAMATVYKGYHPAIGRYVAIKVLSERLAGDATFRARFVREARTIARLEHPSILPVYDCGEDNGMHYLVMRYVDGGTLADVMATGSLSIERVVQLSCRIGEALAYMHRQGVIHRDIKPANILISQDGQVFLGDFGIAKATEERMRLTGAGVAIGTPTYMAPEQVRGQLVDARTDIYALGVLLYHAVTGEVPFAAETAFSMALMHVHARPRVPRELNPALPVALEQVILRAMAKDPAERFQTVEDMVAALGAVCADERASKVGTAQDPIPLDSNSRTPASGRTPAPLVQPIPPQVISGVARVVSKPHPHRRRLVGILIALLICSFTSAGAVIAFSEAIQREVSALAGTAPQRYVLKGTFTIRDQQIIVPRDRNIEAAYREAFIVLARQDPQFGSNAAIDPTAPPTFIGQAQKIRDEPRGMIYRATMQGGVFVPQD